MRKILPLRRGGGGGESLISVGNLSFSSSHATFSDDCPHFSDETFGRPKGFRLGEGGLGGKVTAFRIQAVISLKVDLSGL